MNISEILRANIAEPTKKLARKEVPIMKLKRQKNPNQWHNIHKEVGFLVNYF